MELKSVAVAAALIFGAGSALAGPATPEGAAHLTEVFQTYLGTIDGVVTVVAAGDAYTLTLDAGPLAALAPAGSGTISLTPLVMQLMDQGDGTWVVTEDQALSFSVKIPDMLDLSVEIESLTSKGVFDEKLMAFATSTSAVTNVQVHETITDASQPPMDVQMTMASGKFDSAATAGAAGGVDVKAGYAVTGVSETFKLPPMGEGDPGQPITLAAESYDFTGDLTGYEPEALFQVVAWAVAHPSPDAMEADKGQLKTILLGGLPLFMTMASGGTAHNITVTTPFGVAAIAEMTADVELHGIIADGKAHEAFSISGLSLPDGVLPPWATPILPKAASFGFAVSNYDLAAAAPLLLGLLDLPAGTNPDPSFDATLLAALLPSGTVDIALGPGAISGEGYELTYQGAVSAGPEAEPTGKATVTLTGIDVLTAALAAAPDDVKSQALPMLGMAQGMATPGEAGALVWEIDASSPGTLKINGMDMMGQ